MLATDVDPMAIRRGERGCYRPGSLRDLPADLVAEAFAPSDGELCVKAEYRRAVRFAEQDIRATAPADQFRLILCRNVAFTYFADEVQRKTLRVIRDRLLPGGALVIGILESLPGGVPGFEAWARKAGVYRRVERG
jgi:chemotaxis protein methyltransferase CheR